MNRYDRIFNLTVVKFFLITEISGLMGTAIPVSLSNNINEEG